MKSIKEINEYCILHARHIIIHSGKWKGTGNDYLTKKKEVKK